MLRLYCKRLIIYPRESSSKWRRTGRAGRLLLCLKSCVLVLITSAFYVLLSWAFFSLKKESGCWKPNLHFVQSFYSFAFRNDNYMYFFLVFYFTRQKWCWFSIKQMCKRFCRVKKKMFPLTYLDDRTEFRSLQTTSVFMSAENRLYNIWNNVGDSSESISLSETFSQSNILPPSGSHPVLFYRFSQKRYPVPKCLFNAFSTMLELIKCTQPHNPLEMKSVWSSWSCSSGSFCSSFSWHFVQLQ